MNADFHGRKLTLTWTNVGVDNLPKFKIDREVVQPWDRKALPLQSGLAKDRVMTTAVEMDHDPFGLDFHLAGSLDELAKDLLGGRTAEPLQAVCQPAVAPVGQDRHRHVDIDIQPHLARQTIQMKEVDARPQAILHAVAPGIPDDQRSGRLDQV